MHRKDGAKQVAHEIRHDNRAELTFLNDGDGDLDEGDIQITLTTQGRTRAPVNTAAQERRRSSIRCYKCGRLGHYAYECIEKNDVEGNPLDREKEKTKDKKDTATQLFMHGSCGQQSDDEDINDEGFVFATITEGVGGNTTTTEDAKDDTAPPPQGVSTRPIMNMRAIVGSEAQGDQRDHFSSDDESTGPPWPLADPVDGTPGTGICGRCHGRGPVGEFRRLNCSVRLRYCHLNLITTVCFHCEARDQGRVGEVC